MANASTISRTLIFALASLATAAVAAAAQQQDPPGTPPGGAAPNARPRLFDAVMVVVGDRPILYSAIQEEFEERKASAEQQGERLTPQAERAMRTTILAKLSDEARMAQASKLMGTNVRNQIDAIVEEAIKDYEEQEVRRAGGYDRFMEELGVLGKSLDSVIEDQRTRIQAQLADQQIMSRRLRDQTALLVTPREIKRYFDEHPETFQHERSVDLAVLAVRSTADRDAAQTQAAAIATAWRAPDATLEKLRAAFPDVTLTALGTEQRVSNDATDPRRQWMKDFAAKAKQHDVSEPFATGDTFRLLKAVRVQEGRNDPFESQQVQTVIHGYLQEQKLNRFRYELLQRSRQSIRHWYPPWTRGR